MYIVVVSCFNFYHCSDAETFFYINSLKNFLAPVSNKKPRDVCGAFYVSVSFRCDLSYLRKMPRETSPALGSCHFL